MNDKNLIKIDVKERIRISLDEASINFRARQIPTALNMVRVAESEAKESAQKWKKIIKDKKFLVDVLQEIVERGEEPRDVECKRVFDIANGLTWLEYLDNKYDERAATQKELELIRQGNMFEEFDNDFKNLDLQSTLPQEEVVEQEQEVNDDEVEISKEQLDAIGAF